MSTGDKVTATRPLANPNMRFDIVDYAAMALTAQLACEAENRALMSTPKATAGVATGERWLGSMTANPTNGTDGLFRLDSTTFVGLDANGGLLISPNGTAISISIPAGGSSQQVYAYVADISENTQVRRFLPATAPFNEFANAINIALRQTVGLYVRAGTLGSVVAQDAVAGITRSLLFLGIASNTGGVVTFTPGTNMLETVRTPASFPATDSGTTTVKTTVTGSQNTVRELANAALWILGNTIWKGSDGSNSVVPADANNWGAYQLPAGGVDKAFKQTLGYVTIGDGATTFGDFNITAYANSKLLLDAAVAALPTNGGTIIMKRGVALTSFAGLTVTLPASKAIEIVGDHSGTPTTSPSLSFAAGESIICGTGSLTLRNLHVRWVSNAIQLGSGPFNARDCFFEKQSGTDTGAAITSAVAVSGIDVRDCTCSVTLTAAVTTAMFVRIAGRCDMSGFRRIQLNLLGSDCGGFSITDVRVNVVFEDITCTVSGSFTLSPAIISVNTTDNVTAIQGRTIRRINTQASTIVCVNINSIGNIYIDKLDCTGIGVQSTAWAGAGPVHILNSRVGSISCVGTFTDFKAFNVQIDSTLVVGNVATDQGTIIVDKCRFTAASVYACTLNAAGASRLRVANCEFFGQSHTTLTTFGCARFNAGSNVSGHVAESIEIAGNLVQNFQNIAWAGSNVDCHMFEINTNAAGRIIVENNNAFNVMRSSSGSARLGAYLVELNSSDRSTVAAQMGHVFVRGNMVGEVASTMSSVPDDICMLWKALNVVMWQRAVTVRNEVNSTNAGVAAQSHIANLANITSGTPTIFRSGFIFSDNKVFVQGCGLNMIWDLVHLTFSAGSSNIDVVEFNNNTFSAFGVNVSFDGVNAFGFWLNGTTQIFYGSVLGNIVNEDPFAGGTNWFRINWTAAPTTQSIPSSWPASGAAFANNTQIKRN